MFMEERLQQIASVLKERGKLTVAEIADTYGVSAESARRDLPGWKSRAYASAPTAAPSCHPRWAIVPRRTGILCPCPFMTTIAALHRPQSA